MDINAAFRALLANYYSFKSVSFSEVTSGKSYILVQLPLDIIEPVKTEVVIDHVGQLTLWYRPVGANPDEEFGDMYTESLVDYKKTWFLIKDSELE
jgi:hypothetical protein